MKKSLLIALLGVALASLALGGSQALADAPPGPYFNGFETNTAGWFNNSGATITRVPSGYMTGAGGYANGIPSASGNYHARLGIDPARRMPVRWRAAADLLRPATRTGAATARSSRPAATRPAWISTSTSVGRRTHFDRRFDWASAVNTTTGTHQRDFVFNVGTEPTGFVISGSNNSTRCGAFPGNPVNTPVHVWSPAGIRSSTSSRA